MIAVLALAAAHPAFAQAPLTLDHVKCANGDVTPPERELACSAVIKAGGHPENMAIAYSGRGNSFLRRGDLEKVIQNYSQAIKPDSKFAMAYRNRGAAYFNLGLYDKAAQEYDAVIRLDPRDSSGYSDRCSARAMMGKAKEARADCDKVLELDPSNAEATAFRTLARLQLGDIEEANWDIASIGDAPNDPALRYLWAMVLEAKGEKEEAEGQFEVAQTLDAVEYERLDKLYGRFRRR